jgi:two-component system chemotaxis response regulator CheB
MRKLISEMIDAEPDFTVVGFARNGVDALKQITALDPSVVTLDLEMPQLDGMQVLDQVMSTSPRPIVVLSAGGEQFGDATLRALERGAVDFIKKPSGSISLDLVTIRSQLMEALRAAVSVDVSKLRKLPPPPPVVPTVAGMRARRPAERVVVIASSTGGPRALTEMLPTLPADLPAAVLVAQHMPREFTPSFAHRLNQMCALRVSEGRDGEPLLAGQVYIAPGGAHMRIGGTREHACIQIESNPPRPAVCPSADHLFDSAAQMFGRDVLAVVLTGMGRDGAEGIQTVRAQGGRTIIQDRESSVIYGMPQAALGADGQDRVLPLNAVGETITTTVRTMAEEQAARASRTEEGNHGH